MRKCLTTILFISIYTCISAQMDCSVMYRFEEKPLVDVLKIWKGWCKNANFVYDENEIMDIKITGKQDLIQLKKALDIALGEHNLGWELTPDGNVIIENKSDMIKYVRITGDYKKTPLSRILNIWAFNYKLEFHYESEDLKGIDIFGKLNNVPLDEALSKVLSRTPLDYRIEGKKDIYLYLDDKKTSKRREIEVVTQNVNVSGIIRDKDTGESLPFASILVKGTSQGATTNVDGIFTLFDVPSDTSTLELSYIGYVTSEVALYPDLDLENLELVLNSGGVDLDEITIAAVKKDQILKNNGISKIAMTPEIAGILPSYGEKDIFRSLQLLPGVSGSNESSSGLYVRGGTPDQNLILLDGFTVYHVDHLFGFFSAFNSNSIKDVQLYKGGFESKFGGRLSSVVEMTGKDGNTEEFNMGVNLSLLSVNAFVESPFANGKGSFITTFRRSFKSSFYSSLFDSFSGSPDEDDSASAPPFARFNQQDVTPDSYFYDFNSKWTYRFSNKDKLSFSIYNGEDDLDNSRITDSSNLSGGFGPFGGESSTSFVNDNYDISNWGNIGGSLRWSHQWNNQLYTNTTLSYSNYFSERDRTNEIEITTADTLITRSSGSFEKNDLKDVTLSIANEYKINQYNQLDFGLQITNNDIEYNLTENDSVDLISRADNSVIAAAYIQDKITLGNSLIVQGGLRVNYYGLTEKIYLEPRANFTYLLNEKIKFKGAFGIYNQFATRVIREDISQGSRDFWVLADDDLIPTSKATHYILGASYESSGYLFDVEFFRKDYNGLSEYTTRFESNGFGPNQSLEVSEQFFQGTGISEGAEFLLQRKFGKFSGWLGYTLSRVEYDFPDFSDQPFYANQDQRHEFKVVGSYRIKNWDFSGTFVYSTGTPYTAPVGYYNIELLDGNDAEYFQVSDKNALRYPSYHRMDLSANYNFNMGESKTKLGLSIFNLYGRKNTWYKEYEVIEGELIETDISLLGFTPSLFFSWSLN